MYGTATVQVGMSAFALAMKAKCNQVDEMDVEDTLTLAQQLLGSDDPLHRAVTSFATEYPLVAYDVDRLAVAGDTLGNAVATGAMGTVPGAERADVYG